MPSSNALDPPSLEPHSHPDTSRHHEDYNNSLVFASDEQGSSPGPTTETQQDTSFGLHFASISPGGDTQRIRHSHSEPANNHFLHAAAETNGEDIDSSGQSGGSTQKIAAPDEPHDTQLIGLSERERISIDVESQRTQLLDQDTQIHDDIRIEDGARLNDDTQQIQPPSHPSQLPADDTAIDTSDTQNIHSQAKLASPHSEYKSQPKPLDEAGLSNFSQAIEDIYRGILDDTQRIAPSYGSDNNGPAFDTAATQIITPRSSQQNTMGRQAEESVEFSKPSSLESQDAEFAPQEKAHRQVLNTQEQSDVGLSPKESLENENSSGELSFREGEEVQTDEERIIEEGFSVLDHQYDDSVFTHKKRKLRSKSPLISSPTKPQKHQFKSFNISSNTSKLSSMVIHPKSDPVVLDSASEIVESSPVVKATDFLHLPPKSSPTKDHSIIEEYSEDSDMSEINETGIDMPKITRRKRNLVVESQTQISSNEKSLSSKVLREEASLKLSQRGIHNPESVWGTYNLKVYTGKIIQRGIDQSVVEFSEGLYNINNSDLYLLDIRIGDIIRIRTSTSKFKVTGLARIENDSIQCIRGYNYVYIDKQSTKTSAEVGVPLSDCYMEYSDWILHQETYDIAPNDFATLGTENIPSRRAQRAQTRTQRQRTQPARAVSNPSRNHAEKDNLASTAGTVVSVIKKSLFINQLFCITSIDGERKDQIQTLIEENGGTIIDEGLNELFTYETDSDGRLVLVSQSLGHFTFGCIISNNHCRSAKYLQALALGWPILSDSFIVDCAEHKTGLSEWPVYLLPAGHSKELNSIKSLDVYNFRRKYESNEKLAAQLQNNWHLLEQYNIVVLNNKANGNILETCKFIFYTFGAKSLKYCAKYEEVFDYLKSLNASGGREILIYDDGGSISEKLQGMKKTKRETRKRKSRKSGDIATQQDQIQFGVIDWEWVVQCVISGFIWDTQTYTV